MNQEISQPSSSIAKTKDKLVRPKERFLSLETLNLQEKTRALKSIGEWISSHLTSRERLNSETMGLFKNNRESARPSKAVLELEAELRKHLKG
ncbi:MAG: hypothetical protein WC371_01600 [Parachlamydiales bacterium]|jgi:hypothetical protein